MVSSFEVVFMDGLISLFLCKSLAIMGVCRNFSFHEHRKRDNFRKSIGLMPPSGRPCLPWLDLEHFMVDALQRLQMTRMSYIINFKHSVMFFWHLTDSKHNFRADTLWCFSTVCDSEVVHSLNCVSDFIGKCLLILNVLPWHRL